MQYSVKKVFNYIKWGDIGHCLLCLVVFPFAIIAKLFLRGYWLVCEDKNEARDNGYHFFKWVRENRPKQKIRYAICKKSPDYQKVKPLGKTVGYGTAAHWFWYIVADKNISSQKGGKPNAAVCYFFEVVLKLRKKNRVFLQHGVTINRGPWLYYKNTRMWRFITAAQAEHDYIQEHFGYPAQNVKMLGFSRFDALHNVERDENLILVMPTWRNWLGRESQENKGLDFADTNYCKQWTAFLQDKRLAALLEKYDKKLLFYPHRNMQKFLGYFTSTSERIEIADWKKYDIQEVLKKAALMITDYSSVFFDFSYMRKPVIFYQFDEKEFREKQYEEGYFNYRDTILGEWSDELSDALLLLEKQLEKGMPMHSEESIRQFFPLWDTNNSQRIYDMIKKGA